MTAPKLVIGGKAADDVSLLSKPRHDPWAAQRALLKLDEPVKVVASPTTSFPSPEAAVSALWGLFREAHLAEADRRVLAAERERLAPRIADPALFGHARRPAAVERFDALREEAAHKAGRAESCAWAMAKIWAALPEASRAELIERGWWPGTDKEGFRRWIEACVACGHLPGDEVGF